MHLTAVKASRHAHRPVLTPSANVAAAELHTIYSSNRPACALTLTTGPAVLVVLWSVQCPHAFSKESARTTPTSAVYLGSEGEIWVAWSRTTSLGPVRAYNACGADRTPKGTQSARHE